MKKVTRVHKDRIMKLNFKGTDLIWFFHRQNEPVKLNNDKQNQNCRIS